MHANRQVGLLLPTREAAIRDHPSVREIVELGALAERSGFDSVWAGDSILARPRADPLHVLSAVAATTESVTLGTAVYLPALRHPVLVAHAVATVDQLAEGRLILGVGAGFGYPATEAEFDTVGASFGQRVGRMVETIDICRHLWNTEPGTTTDFEGRPTRSVASGPRRRSVRARMVQVVASALRPSRCSLVRWAKKTD